MRKINLELSPKEEIKSIGDEELQICLQRSNGSNDNEMGPEQMNIIDSYMNTAKPASQLDHTKEPFNQLV